MWKAFVHASRAQQTVHLAPPSCPADENCLHVWEERLSCHLSCLCSFILLTETLQNPDRKSSEELARPLSSSYEMRIAIKYRYQWLSGHISCHTCQMACGLLVKHDLCLPSVMALWGFETRASSPQATKPPGRNVAVRKWRSSHIFHLGTNWKMYLTTSVHVNSFNPKRIFNRILTRKTYRKYVKDATESS